MTPLASDPWYEKAFGPIYLELYGHRDESEAGRAVEILAHRLPGVAAATSGGRPLLDIACGAGRYLGALRDRGVSAVGLDLSPYLLKHALLHAPGHVVRGDMRCLPFRDGAFGGAISMFTSFGYFSRLAENQEVLEAAHRVIAASGGLAIDYFNSFPTLKSLVPENHRTVGRFHVVERRRLCPGPDGVERIVKTVDVTEGSVHVDTLHEEVMVISPDQLARLVEDAGFEIIERLGDYGGEPFDVERSPRCILLCRRVP